MATDQIDSLKNMATVRMRVENSETELVLEELSKYSQKTMVSSVDEDESGKAELEMESDSDEDESSSQLCPKYIHRKVVHSLDYGEYTVPYEDHPIQASYKTYGAPVGLMDCVAHLENLYLML